MAEAQEKEMKMEMEMGHTTKIMAEPGRMYLDIEQTYDAPREKIFKLLTDKKLIPQWWGPRNLTTKVERMDAKTGGSWRIVQKDKEGKTYEFHGVYHEVTKPERIVRTMEYGGMPGHVSLEFYMLEGNNGKTIVKGKTLFMSVEDRDGMISSGMEKGVMESEERANEVLMKM